MLTKNFKQDLELIKSKISNKEPFSLARYADFELAILLNRPITSCDKLTITPADKKFSEELRETMNHTEDNYYYGISCPCCDTTSFKFYQDVFKFNWDNVTFSNMFVNANWKPSVDFLLNHNDKVFIANENSKLEESYYKVPSNVLVAYRTERESMKSYFEKVAEQHNETLFCISAGPIAEILIHWMYNKNSNNQYVDVGSSLDMYIHKRPTRSYHHGNHRNASKVCIL